MYSVSTKNGPPKYNGVVFEILAKHRHFYNRIWHIFVHCVQKFVEISRKDRILLCFQLLIQKPSFRDNTGWRTFTVISNEAVWLFINCCNLLLDEEL